MNKEPKYQSLSHWGLYPIEEKEELKHMSDTQAFKELDKFVADYKNERKFKKGDHVLYNDYELGWTPAVILKKIGKTEAFLAVMVEDTVRLMYSETSQLMKASKQTTKEENLNINFHKVIEDYFQNRDVKRDAWPVYDPFHPNGYTLMFSQEYPSGSYGQR